MYNITKKRVFIYTKVLKTNHSYSSFWPRELHHHRRMNSCQSACLWSMFWQRLVRTLSFGTRLSMNQMDIVKSWEQTPWQDCWHSCACIVSLHLDWIPNHIMSCHETNQVYKKFTCTEAIMYMTIRRLRSGKALTMAMASSEFSANLTHSSYNSVGINGFSRSRSQYLSKEAGTLGSVMPVAS